MPLYAVQFNPVHFISAAFSLYHTLIQSNRYFNLLHAAVFSPTLQAFLPLSTHPYIIHKNASHAHLPLEFKSHHQIPLSKYPPSPPSSSPSLPNLIHTFLFHSFRPQPNLYQISKTTRISSHPHPQNAYQPPPKSKPHQNNIQTTQTSNFNFQTLNL